MNHRTHHLERVRRDESDARPTAIARRAVLARGAKLAYIVPAILAALSPPARAASIHGGNNQGGNNQGGNNQGGNNQGGNNQG
jgi:hypothetical protein